MNYIQLTGYLQLVTNDTVSLSNISDILNLSRQVITKYKHSDVSIERLELIEKYYNVSIPKNIIQSGVINLSAEIAKSADAVEIKYLDIPSLMNTIKNPEITSIWLDRELVNYKWKKDEKDLRIIQMPGDTMENDEYCLKDEDILVIDTSIVNTQRSGIFAFTTKNDTLIFVNGLKQRPDGSIRFYYLNKNYESVIYSAAELKAMGFKVIGKFIKNMSID